MAGSTDLFVKDLARTAAGDPSRGRDMLEALAEALGDQYRRPTGRYAEAAYRAGRRVEEALLEYCRVVDRDGEWSWEDGAPVEPELPFADDGRMAA